MFGFRSSEFFWKNPNFSNSQKFHENSSEISLEIISCFGVKKTLFWGHNIRKKFRNPCFGVKNRGFQTFGIFLTPFDDACLTLFVSILFSYKCVFLRILSSVKKLTQVKQQVLLFTQEVLVEI